MGPWSQGWKELDTQNRNRTRDCFSHLQNVRCVGWEKLQSDVVQLKVTLVAGAVVDKEENLALLTATARRFPLSSSLKSWLHR